MITEILSFFEAAFFLFFHFTNKIVIEYPRILWSACKLKWVWNCFERVRRKNNFRYKWTQTICCIQSSFLLINLSKQFEHQCQEINIHSKNKQLFYFDNYFFFVLKNPCNSSLTHFIALLAVKSWKLKKNWIKFWKLKKFHVSISWMIEKLSTALSHKTFITCSNKHPKVCWAFYLFFQIKSFFQMNFSNRMFSLLFLSSFLHRTENMFSEKNHKNLLSNLLYILSSNVYQTFQQKFNEGWLSNI